MSVKFSHTEYTEQEQNHAMEVAGEIFWDVEFKTPQDEIKAMEQVASYVLQMRNPTPSVSIGDVEKLNKEIEKLTNEIKHWEESKEQVIEAEQNLRNKYGKMEAVCIKIWHRDKLNLPIDIEEELEQALKSK